MPIGRHSGNSGYSTPDMSRFLRKDGLRSGFFHPAWLALPYMVSGGGFLFSFSQRIPSYERKGLNHWTGARPLFFLYGYCPLSFFSS